MRVLFTATPGRFSLPRGEVYEAGRVYDLTADQAGRWKRRGVAVDAPPEPAPEPVPEPVAVAAPAPRPAPFRHGRR